MRIFNNSTCQIPGGLAGVAFAAFFGVIGGLLMLEAVRALLDVEELLTQSVLSISSEFVLNNLDRAKLPPTNPMMSFLVRFNAVSYLLMGSCSVFLLADKLLSREGTEG